jgi:hypothetical protein
LTHRWSRSMHQRFPLGKKRPSFPCARSSVVGKGGMTGPGDMGSERRANDRHPQRHPGRSVLCLARLHPLRLPRHLRGADPFSAVLAPDGRPFA